MTPLIRAICLASAFALSGCSIVAQDGRPAPRPAPDAPSPRGGSFGVPGLVAVSRDAMGSGGCYVAAPIEVTEVAGIRLSRPSLMTLETAKALTTWVEEGAKPAIGERGGGLAEMRVAAHYACRNRNHQAGARLSEHSKAKAIDLSEFTMRDGSVITVEDGWRSEADGKILRYMHAAACGPFGTVLGPDSDRFHYNHFHFDTASYRSGPYCR
ncbi:MAG: extensin family protein [Pseudomonadota bacterium]